MLMVCADHRGKGIGESLLLALESACDTSKLFVTTNESNRRMQKLLLRLGYRRCGYIEELDPGDPELVFVKIIRDIT
jgi:ribosomal protein S18 acetylase RimI-like enzyme